MILVTFSWYRICVLFQAQIEKAQIESVAMAVAFWHGLNRQDIGVSY